MVLSLMTAIHVSNTAKPKTAGQPYSRGSRRNFIHDLIHAIHAGVHNRRSALFTRSVTLFTAQAITKPATPLGVGFRMPGRCNAADECQDAEAVTR
jgi:hypothetical protein